MIRLLFSRQWWWTTLLVIAAAGVMVRLGMWQLDRLDQRRGFNARVSAQIARPPLTLDAASLAEDLAGMEYRQVVVTGTYDHAQQVALRNQEHDGRLGVHLLTPLRIAGADMAVLVDRGWIPAEDAAPERWGAYDEPGLVEVRGVIRQSRGRPDFGGVADPTPAPGQRLSAWNMANVEGIGRQTSLRLAPIYVQQAPDPPRAALPARSQPQLDLGEGSHMGYALQWFAFAAVLAIGYLRYLRVQSRATASQAANDRAAASAASHRISSQR